MKKKNPYILFLTKENFIAYEITTTKKEKNELKNNSLNDNLTIIDLGLCENILRGKYGIKILKCIFLVIIFKVLMKIFH